MVEQVIGIDRLVVYSYRPDGAHVQRKWALAKGDRPQDVLTRHGTKETAVRAGKRLADKLGVPLSVED